MCFLSVILTRASKLLDVARAAGIEHGGAVIPSHVRVCAGVEELSRDLRVTLLAGGEQRRNTPGRLLVDWRTMGQQQVHEGGVVVASSKVQTGIRLLRAVPFGVDRVAPPDGALRRAEAARRLAMELGTVPRSTWLF